MTDRVLDFSRDPASLSIRNGLLIVRRGGAEIDAIPCGEIAAVVISHREVIFTQAVLATLAESGAALIACDSRHRPAAMMLPLEAHHVQAERFARQPAMRRPRQKRLWQQIIRAKIVQQALVLKECTGTSGGLDALVSRVQSGDPTNVEARAARRYWSLLFGDVPFARINEDDARNHWLDYGYAVLRAATARAICASGLHPTFGLAHRSKANAFALADDLMEPFRPVVDRVVANAEARTLDGEAKRELIGAVTARYIVEDESRTLFDILTRIAQSLASVVMGWSSELWLPYWRPEDAMRKPAARAPSVPDQRADSQTA
jgi:CRISPR-associated protein Cas1